LGAFEVVVRTSCGLSCTLHSKLRSKTFPVLDQLMGALFYFLGDSRQWSPQSIADGRQQLHEAIAAGDSVALQRYLAAAPYLALNRDARGRSMVQLAELHGRQQCARILRRGDDADSPLKQVGQRQAEPAPRFAPLQAGVRVEPVSVASSDAQLAGVAGCVDDSGYVKDYSRNDSQPQRSYDHIPAPSYADGAPPPGHGERSHGGYYIRPAAEFIDHRPNDSAGYTCGSREHRDSSPSRYGDRPYDVEHRYDARRRDEADRPNGGVARYEGDHRHDSDRRQALEAPYELDRRYAADGHFTADRRYDADRRCCADCPSDAGQRFGAGTTYNDPLRCSHPYDAVEPSHCGSGAATDHGFQRRDYTPAHYERARSIVSSDGEGD
jgi:hypothetical protein